MHREGRRLVSQAVWIWSALRALGVCARRDTRPLRLRLPFFLYMLQKLFIYVPVCIPADSCMDEHAHAAIYGHAYTLRERERFERQVPMLRVSLVIPLQQED